MILGVENTIFVDRSHLRNMIQNKQDYMYS